jgi:hypothetical protein
MPRRIQNSIANTVKIGDVEVDFGYAKRPKGLRQLLGPGSFGGVLRRLHDGDRPDGSHLALVLEANKDQPLPPALHAYLCRYLRGEIKPKPGPKPPSFSVDSLNAALAGILYIKAHRVFKKLKARAKRFRRKGVFTNPTPNKPPSELALDLVRRRMKRFQKLNNRALHNLLSKQGFLKGSL